MRTPRCLRRGAEAGEDRPPGPRVMDQAAPNSNVTTQGPPGHEDGHTSASPGINLASLKPPVPGPWQGRFPATRPLPASERPWLPPREDARGHPRCRSPTPCQGPGRRNHWTALLLPQAHTWKASSPTPPGVPRPGLLLLPASGNELRAQLCRMGTGPSCAHPGFTEVRRRPQEPSLLLSLTVPLCAVVASTASSSCRLRGAPPHPPQACKAKDLAGQDSPAGKADPPPCSQGISFLERPPDHLGSRAPPVLAYSEAGSTSTLCGPWGQHSVCLKGDGVPRLVASLPQGQSYWCGQEGLQPSCFPALPNLPGPWHHQWAQLLQSGGPGDGPTSQHPSSSESRALCGGGSHTGTRRT